MTPLAPGSVSLRLYPHDLPATDQVEVLRRQARRASEIGYDGVMVSEHHADFPGYLPNPVQLAGLLLDAMPTGWVAPCPMLLPLKPYALIAEDLAWLAAAYPGRVGAGFAAGALSVDFELAEVPFDEIVDYVSRPHCRRSSMRCGATTPAHSAPTARSGALRPTRCQSLSLLRARRRAGERLGWDVGCSTTAFNHLRSLHGSALRTVRPEPRQGEF